MKEIVQNQKKWIVITVTLLSVCQSLLGTGIIGGQDGTGDQPAYAALVAPNGALSSLSGEGFPTTNGQINSVAINEAGAGIIGGSEGANAYAALVAPSGTLMELALPAVTENVASVAINETGTGIIGVGGGEEGIFKATPYAALVASDGVLTELNLPFSEGSILSVAINETGTGIIGGVTEVTDPYAALVMPSDENPMILPLPFVESIVRSVAINDAGVGIIGAETGIGGEAVLVRADGSVQELVGQGLPGGGGVYSVAINNSGTGIIGLQQDDGFKYIVLVRADENIEQVFLGIQGPMAIQSVAINDAGTGIIGGRIDDLGAYAALVTPDGTVQRLSGEGFPATGNGFINSVAINNVGVGIIGGFSGEGNMPAYAALVAPDGTLTPLFGENFPLISGSINGVDSVANRAVPKSFGPGNSFANPLFSLTSQILPNHAMHHRAGYNSAYHATDVSHEVGLLADATDAIRTDLACFQRDDYAVWLAGFGAYTHQKKERDFVALTNWIGGAMLGFDYRNLKDAVVGLGVAYAYNHVDYAENAGRARFHQEFLTLYGSWNRKVFFINLALWGGLYQLRNERNTLGLMTSTANVDGWLLVPHLEMSAPFHRIDTWFVIEPFVMFDWANNWQGSVEESGTSGFHLVLGSTYMSLLRSEVGFRFFESIRYQWGKFLLQQKASFVNKTPFSVETQNAAFIASISSFGIETFSNKMQNLGVLQLSFQFIPCHYKYPYGTFNYQGEFGSSFQSHVISIEIGKYF
ncbi:MAG: autotransporter outer membrane beta-barrel domain-containing protein [Chlamydiota bacterium]